MRVKIEALLKYTLPHPAEILLGVEVIPMHDQQLVNDVLNVSGAGPLRAVKGEDDLGQRTWMEGAGDVDIAYSALVDVERAPTRLNGLAAGPRRELPPHVISYLFPSRYCESDRLTPFVGSMFGPMANGDVVRNMADWVYEQVAYSPGSSNGTTTATDTFLMRQGVCRDFAHLLISFARAGGVPARMVSVYAPNLTPPDFHAVVEVWLEGEWRLIDPSRLASEEKLVRIAVGRDATDISFMTIFGVAEFREQSVLVSGV